MGTAENPNRAAALLCGYKKKKLPKNLILEL
jgi:hypothetical protein